MTRETCATCKAFDITLPNSGFGKCRISPPRAERDTYGTVSGLWPTVKTTEWCLEHIPVEIHTRAAGEVVLT